MYIVTKTAAWWEEPANAKGVAAAAQDGNEIEALRALLLPPTTDATRRITRWAARPLPLHQGKCLALRFEGTNEPQVLLQRRNRREWLPMSRLLSGGQARQWALEGFFRAR